MSQIGGAEITIIGLVIILLIGGKKLPELGRGLGQSVKELKNAFKDQDKEKGN